MGEIVVVGSGDDDGLIVDRAIQSLGLGFDLTSDFRLRFAKRSVCGKRLVVLDEENLKDIVIPGGSVVRRVSKDISCDKGDRVRFKSDVLEFNQMAELLNQNSSVQGKIPSGYFNSLFELSGAWLNDCTDTKYLAFDAYVISLYSLHLTASPLVLQEKVKKSVPCYWDPASLSRFIQMYGTHIIIGMAVGGQDVICVKQKPSSTICPADLKGHLEDLGDFWFSDGCTLSPKKTKETKQKVPEIFKRILQSNTMQLASVTETSSKDGLAIVCSKRGGDVFLHTHCKWLQTVSANPDAIRFKFVPITSLLTGIAGSGYLSHAINLYLRYKPAPEDLRYFLEFQVPRQWAPMFNELPLGHQRRKGYCPALQFSLFGPQLHVSSIQVSSDGKPVIGLRLYLEGKKCNHLAVHVEHLSSIPKIFGPSSTSPSAQRPCTWIGSDDSERNPRYLEPINWKRFSKVCTSAVKYDPRWSKDGVFVVTGAQLFTKGKWPKTILHLRLLFSHLPHCTIQKTEWAIVSSASQKSSFFSTLSSTFTQREVIMPKQLPSAINSGVFPDGPPARINSHKLLKFVDTTEVVRGPHDSPGHWLVIAAKLITEGRKIGLHVKFGLLNYSM
ncbi:hypothetical protein GIB67_024493 [Kingdonia uniflora]|uniref:MACPF domain-containing protein n=1 Tax=Kingdonia uniflora TaxID=39325 RepID=A0A7J7LNN1_9MAGN|nr:hypothetical protein GIB67_024493 [Kingdonia uniflora]